MIIITYVDDCIIVSHSMKDINTFVKSMKHGNKGYVLTDEGDIKKTWNHNKRILESKYKKLQRTNSNYHNHS
jgi:hypothetical protein